MGQFYQANAGFGEYVTGTGEYVSDGSLAPVSDFGEYVASGLQVEGYGDYEVLPSFSGSADGFGYINDGVRPDGNLDAEFGVMEAAAGLGAGPGMLTGGGPGTRSDYVPTTQMSVVGGQEIAPDTGIFDVGGSNGVFG
jgi:hypothetical protein